MERLKQESATDDKPTAAEYEKQRAAHWLEVGAEAGHPGSQYILGAAYYAGNDRQRDYQKALHWLAKSAEQGHAGARYLVGETYANGHGVVPDPAWAARWYGKAAEQGHLDAQFALGMLNEAGLGVPKDQARGLLWLRLAARGGHAEATKARDDVERKLTPKQRTRAAARAKRWAPTTRRHFADRSTVRYVQYALQRLGHPAGPIDGIQGPRTFNGVTAYQRAVGMTQEKAVTPALVDRLRADSNKQN